MNKIFVDTDIILDLLARRLPHFHFSAVLVHIIDSSEAVVDKALNSDFADFEDAVHYYTSQENGINILLTRNLRNYKNASLVVQTPETFLVSNGLI